MVIFSIATEAIGVFSPVVQNVEEELALRNLKTLPIKRATNQFDFDFVSHDIPPQTT